MTELIFQVAEPPEGGYTARALGHSIFTEADTLDGLRANIREAVQSTLKRAKRLKPFCSKWTRGRPLRLAWRTASPGAR